uniref:Uncharacterized protein n=1 Tax=Arundo donax TaxID=35708 RepID=A0A0A9EHM1_ARUDO
MVGTNGQWQTAYSQQKVFDGGSCSSVLDSFAHNRLSTSYALPQHPGSHCACSCQTTKHAQGSDFRNQCRQLSSSTPR